MFRGKLLIWFENIVSSLKNMTYSQTIIYLLRKYELLCPEQCFSEENSLYGITTAGETPMEEASAHQGAGAQYMYKRGAGH